MPSPPPAVHPTREEFTERRRAYLDLPGATLGQALGSTIWIDVNAAGWGWSVSRELRAKSGEPEGPADDRMDLVSAVMHELGHVLGFDDLDGDTEDVMNASLATGVRRDLAPAVLDGLFADADFLENEGF